MRKSPSISGMNISFPRIALNTGTPMVSTSGTRRIDPMNFVLRFNVNARELIDGLDALIEKREVVAQPEWVVIIGLHVFCNPCDGLHQARHAGILGRHYDPKQIILPNLDVLLDLQFDRRRSIIAFRRRAFVEEPTERHDLGVTHIKIVLLFDLLLASGTPMKIPISGLEIE